MPTYNETAIERAILAGSDILALANNSAVFDPTIPMHAFDVIKRLVDNGSSRSRASTSRTSGFYD